MDPREAEHFVNDERRRQLALEEHVETTARASVLIERHLRRLVLIVGVAVVAWFVSYLR